MEKCRLKPAQSIRDVFVQDWAIALGEAMQARMQRASATERYGKVQTRRISASESLQSREARIKEKYIDASARLYKPKPKPEYCISRSRLVKVFFFNFVFNIYYTMLYCEVSFFNIIPLGWGYEVTLCIMRKYATLCARRERKRVCRLAWASRSGVDIHGRESQHCIVAFFTFRSRCFFEAFWWLGHFHYTYAACSMGRALVRSLFRVHLSAAAYIIASEGQYFTIRVVFFSSALSLDALLPEKTTEQHESELREERLPRVRDGMECLTPRLHPNGKRAWCRFIYFRYAIFSLRLSLLSGRRRPYSTECWTLSGPVTASIKLDGKSVSPIFARKAKTFTCTHESRFCPQ